MTFAQSFLNASPDPALLERCAVRLKALAGETWPHFTLPRQSADLVAARPIVEKLLNNTTDVVLLGTGGSALGAATLAALVQGPLHQPQGRPRLHVADNLDGASFTALLGALDLRTTRFLVVSKSGSTAETMSQFLAAIAALNAAGGGKYLKHHFLVITEPKDNVLRRLATHYDLPVLDHDPDLGGRYSVLSLVGLVPGLVLGLDVDAVRRGAAGVLDQAFHAPVVEVPAALGAAVAVGLAHRGITQNVMFGYGDRFALLTAWWRQLWAESLGKQGKGLTPVPALGPVDQHSQLQLFLDGPKDKLYLILSADTTAEGPEIPADLASDPALAWLAGKRVGQLVAAQVRATTDALANRGHAIRRIALPRLDEETLGALFMSFMLETILAADLLGVDPFDQPAVEESKILARQYLAET
ncbi:glucose-6-phosphate isomerase [Zavarzinia sp. CC-PAN008]|uniref:glucose-6-phosphate isomerase n=1 Tax=Zavarzinia sp. CC-PAN008 TaxID=3243332 RepID=UPI003F7491E0